MKRWILLSGMSLWMVAAAMAASTSLDLNQGENNMKMGNYRAAIEAYDKVLASDPDNRTALRGLAKAYCEEGLIEKSVKLTDRYLKKYPKDAGVAFEEAQALDTPQLRYRRQDAIRYFEMGLTLKDDPRMRLAYANLLAEERSTVRDAIPQYEQILKKDPGNTLAKQGEVQAMLWDADLLSEQKGTVPQAIDRYKDILKIDPENKRARRELRHMLLWYGGILTEETETMPQAIALYETLYNHNYRDDEVRQRLIQTRLEYAGIMGENLETTPEAIHQYKEVVDIDPSNPEAHYGLARAYAWNGDADDALYQTRLAEQKPAPRGVNMSGLKPLDEKLSKGREPNVWTDVQGFSQRNANYALDGVVGSARTTFNPTPFTTSSIDVGYGRYQHGSDRANDPYFLLGLQYRMATTHHLDVQAGYHSLSGGEGLYRVQYGYDATGGRWWIRSGFKRELKYDSFLALAGKTFNGQTYGAAHTDLFFVDSGTQWRYFTLTVSPYLGIVRAGSVPNNGVRGMDTTVDVPIVHADSTTWSFGYTLQVMAFDKDESGFTPRVGEPFAGGYFSPQAFVNQIPHLGYKKTTDHYDLEFHGGPALQYIKFFGSPGTDQVGADVGLTWTYKLLPDLRIQLSPGFIRIATVYNRIYGMGSINYVFGRF